MLWVLNSSPGTCSPSERAQIQAPGWTPWHLGVLGALLQWPERTRNPRNRWLVKAATSKWGTGPGGGQKPVSSQRGGSAFSEEK